MLSYRDKTFGADDNVVNDPRHNSTWTHLGLPTPLGLELLARPRLIALEQHQRRLAAARKEADERTEHWRKGLRGRAIRLRNYAATLEYQLDDTMPALPQGPIGQQPPPQSLAACTLARDLYAALRDTHRKHLADQVRAVAARLEEHAERTRAVVRGEEPPSWIGELDEEVRLGVISRQLGGPGSLKVEFADEGHADAA